MLPTKETSLQSLRNSPFECMEEPSEIASQTGSWKCNRRKTWTYKFDNEETDRASSVQSKHTYLNPGKKNTHKMQIIEIFFQVVLKIATLCLSAR